MSDDLLRRMQHADPARGDEPADPWLDDLVEATMSSTSDRTARRWAPLAAAAAVLAVAAGTAGIALNGGEREPAPQAQPRTVTELTLPDDGTSMGMCVRLTPETLRNVDQALAGTATEVTDDRVVLTVDRWYKGGDTDLVALTPADPSMVALLGAVEFEQGARYLVSAADGHVNSCGFTGPYSADLAAVYDAAFPG